MCCFQILSKFSSFVKPEVLTGCNWRTGDEWVRNLKILEKNPLKEMS
jgi:hypothetical protein